MTITTRWTRRGQGWTRRGNLDHNDKDDEEDKVSVQVGVAVPLLLLVETHLTKEKSLGNFLLLRCPDRRECFRKLFISKVSPRCYGWVFQYGRWCSFAPLQRICAFVEQRKKNLNFPFAEQISTNQWAALVLLPGLLESFAYLTLSPGFCFHQFLLVICDWYWLIACWG